MARRRFLPGLRGLETKGWGTWAAPSPTYFAPTSDAMQRAWPVERAVAEGYERTVWVYKSVHAIATHQARLDFILRDGDDLVDDHPLLDLLNDGRANPLESGRQFRSRLSAQILLSPAGAFVEVTESRRGTPVRLDLLPPGRTRPVPGRGADLLSHFETVAPDGRRIGIDPERVRWFRDPHPLDPFRGMTPLEAAGLSVDLDFLSRLYNVVFIRNDGRPATVVGVEGEAAPGELDRIEARFGRGPMEAGKVSVLSGKISVADLGKTPRDMAYGEAAGRAKEEVLAAFGVGETVLGNASGRTFDNADAELYQFWTITMDGHIGIVTSGFDSDTDDGIVCDLDTSKVEVLRRVAAARRQEAREEFNAGLISPDEYRKIAEHDEVDLPHTRALYIAQGKTPIPTREEDAEALGLAGPAEEAPPGEELPPGEQAPPGEEMPVDGQQPPTSPGQPGGPEPTAAIDRLQAMLDSGETKALAALVEPPTLASETVSPKSTTVVVEPAPVDPRDLLEQELVETMERLMRRLVARTAARVAGTKARKGTRHWEPEYEVDTRVGDAPIDVARVVDPAHWQDEAAAALAPVFAAGALAAGAALAGSVGAIVGEMAAITANQVAAAGTAWLASRVAQAATDLSGIIAARDRGGADMADITLRIHADLPSLEAWGRRLACQVAGNVAHAAESAVAAELAGTDGLATATWRVDSEETGRLAHREAHGQVQPAGGAFRVGRAMLAWPCDVDGPLEQVSGCRCRLRWMVVPGS
ncbi:phage portal protein [Nonomuraea sp. NPDC005650]|uniref:phage portal protein n=1 Tax=Nonomuraea sp. NPDC005650 TaxID=3157045 RepID=UPI00339F2AD6